MSKFPIPALLRTGIPWLFVHGFDPISYGGWDL